MTVPDELWVDRAELLDEQDDRGDLGRLITALRQRASPEELDGEEPIVAAMQAALARTSGAQRVGHRRRLVGRVAVVKGSVAVGALVFGVAAAAATTGVVDVPRLPGWPDDSAPVDAPAVPTSIGSRPDMDGSSEVSGAAGDADGDGETGPAPETETGETSGSGTSGDPGRASITPDPAPASTSTSTTGPTAGPTTTIPPSDVEGGPASPGKANPPPPPVSLPPPAEQRPHGPPGDGDSPPCAQGSSAGDAARDRAASEPLCPPQP
jgi:hypothetical protein